MNATGGEVRPALTHAFAGFLPTVGHPSAVAFVSYFAFKVSHLVYCSSKVSSLVQGTFTPQQHARAGRTQRLAEYGDSAEALMSWLCDYALSREPNSDELQLASEFLGTKPTQQAVEDLLWSVFMLPEFQLVR